MFSKQSAGTIIGIIIASVVLVILIILVALVVIRKRRDGGGAASGGGASGGRGGSVKHVEMVDEPSEGQSAPAGTGGEPAGNPMSV